MRKSRSVAAVEQCLKLGRLDALSIHRADDLEDFEALLRHPSEVRRRKKILAYILTVPEACAYVEGQLYDRYHLVRRQYLLDQMVVASEHDLFFLDRLLLEVRVIAEDVPEREWPKLHALVRLYKRLTNDAAGLRLAACNLSFSAFRRIPVAVC